MISVGIGDGDELSGVVAAIMLSSLPKSGGSFKVTSRFCSRRDYTHQHDRLDMNLRAQATKGRRIPDGTDVDPRTEGRADHHHSRNRPYKLGTFPSQWSLAHGWHLLGRCHDRSYHGSQPRLAILDVSLNSTAWLHRQPSSSRSLRARFRQKGVGSACCHHSRDPRP